MELKKNKMDECLIKLIKLVNKNKLIWYKVSVKINTYYTKYKKWIIYIDNCKLEIKKIDNDASIIIDNSLIVENLYTIVQNKLTDIDKFIDSILKEEGEINEIMYD